MHQKYCGRNCFSKEIMKMKNILKVLFVVVVFIGIYSCNKGIDYEKMRQAELAILNEYISLHDEFEETASGLYYYNEPGTGSGDTIKMGDQVQIFYATWVLEKNSNGDLDSIPVDQTNGYDEGYRYEPYKFTVGAGKSVTGLEEAVTYMQPGTKSHLVINSELAYGQNGSGSVGMFQTVLMEVEVYKVIPLEY